ncbi:retropepsin-like aspartic protease [Myxococcus sp. SDU36]|uniref:retropepsin-like aspartic protease n=1 Tax=Myxococcus sp. SDU36 TaxID=2831967 RepID=UPI0025427600|nr:retropepsin-like aspartic protease [Myxococcus sp. SDU36]
MAEHKGAVLVEEGEPPPSGPCLRTKSSRRSSVASRRAGDEDLYDLFLNEADGALHGLRIRENNVTRFARMRDWRQVQGVRMPFLEEVLTDNPDSANGQTTQVLLDSGAEMTVVDTAYARGLGLKTQGQLAAVGSGGQAQAQLAGGVDITLGNLTLTGLTVAVIDLSEVARLIGHPLPVILGKEAFNQLVVDVDFPNRRVAIAVSRHGQDGGAHVEGRRQAPAHPSRLLLT